jgi:hypothetical protein
MSHDPSQAFGTRSVQIDINSASVLSDDITQHTETSITAKSVYFIDVRHMYSTNLSGTGCIAYRNFNNFLPFGGQFKVNNVSSGSTSCDESYCGVNTRNTALTVFVNNINGGNITANNSFKSLWRIL